VTASRLPVSDESETSGEREYDPACLCSAPHERQCGDRHLRLARIATADAASRAGLDYEEIDDIRIAVSELCSVVSVAASSSVTLAFLAAAGGLTVEGEARTGRDEIIPNELSRAIVAAVADEHSLVTDDGVTRFRVVKRRRSSAS
jgi:hypothetical protein